MPAVVGDGADTTAASDVTCAAGPLGLIGVTTGRYPAPQPATRAAVRRATPAWTNRMCAWLTCMGKRLIQFRSCLLADCKSVTRAPKGPAGARPLYGIRGHRF